MTPGNSSASAIQRPSSSLSSSIERLTHPWYVRAGAHLSSPLRRCTRVVDDHSGDRFTVFFLFRRVDAVSRGVHGDAVHQLLDGKILDLPKVVFVVFLDHRDEAAGAGGIRASVSRIEFDHVR